MNKNILGLIFSAFMIPISLTAQETTVGLISYDATSAYEGYTLIYPHNQSFVYLLDLCGEIVHQWSDDADFRPGNTAYLRADGSLVKTKRPSSVAGDAIWAGGGGAIVEIRSWDNDLIWSYELNNENFRLHHDIAPMKNGNLLLLAWEKKTRAEAEAQGRLPDLLAQDDLWPEYVFEINPTTDDIVWEWHVWDHLIQDVDSAKPNFGVISDHKELIDLNYDRNDAKSDWLHINAIDYNEDLDQIMLSVPYFNELWVIDHTTTTEQAAGHIGGFVNHGGDLIYRLGNPAAYRQGDTTDQVLFFQHDAHWANEFLPEAHPNKNDIIAFNNRVGEDFSTAEIFKSSWFMYISDYQSFNGTFLPESSDNTICHPIKTDMHSTGLSSVQLLPNGNSLICSGRQGSIFELTPGNELVWEYRVPLVAGAPAEQGTILALNDNNTFRAFKYPVDYSAFTGRDLTPQGFIELNPMEDYCDRLVSTNMPDKFSFAVYPNPTSDMIHFTWDTGSQIDIRIVNTIGHTVKTTRGVRGMTFIDVSELNTGIYYIIPDNYRAIKLLIE